MTRECVEFYKNMKVVASDTISSKVKGKDIMIKPDTIATYLHYPWPIRTQIQYPQGNYISLAEQNYAKAIYENPIDFTAKRKFVLGKFKPEYKLMTEIIHFNISPAMFEKELNLDDVEFLYVMMIPW